MKSSNHTRLAVIWEKGYLQVILVLVLLSIIGLTVINDYGVVSDERADMLSVFWNRRLLSTGEPIPDTRVYYGNVFPFASEIAFQAWSLSANGSFDSDLSSNAEERLTASEFRERAGFKHKFTFLFSLIAYISVAGIVGILVGRKYAWIGPIALALFPGFWGHGFFNPKDIPYAAMFTLGTFLGVELLAKYLQSNSDDVKLGFNRITLYTLLYGALVGIVTGTRIAGCFLLFFVAVVHLTLSVLKRNPARSFLRFFALYGLMFLSWMATVFVIHPASWSNPFRWLFEALTSLSRYEWEGVNLFNGQFVSAQATPWYYLPVWLGITTPLILLVLSFTGVFIFILKFQKLSIKQQACGILVILQVAFLPAIAILRNSTIYDGYRQFLFILPGAAAFAAAAFGWLLSSLKRRTHRLVAFALAGILIAPIIVDMTMLHPYEYVYFNRAFGGLKQAYNRFDTDYWGLSMREAMEWINTHAGPDARVVSSRPYISSETFADRGIQMLRIHEFDETTAVRPFYSLVLDRFEPALGEKFADCEIVFRVVRFGIPLSTVKQCN